MLSSALLLMALHSVILISMVESLTALIRVSDTTVTAERAIHVICVSPSTVRGTSWRLYRGTQETPFRTEVVEGHQHQFSVTGRELIHGMKQPGPYFDVRISCGYTEAETHSHSQRSEQTTVEVLDYPRVLPQPHLTVSADVIRERDPVLLSCKGPQSLNVAQCHFYTEIRELTVTPSTCQHSFTGADLLTEERLGADTQVKLTCSYIAKMEGHDKKSKFSDYTTVTVKGLKHSTQTPWDIVIVKGILIHQTTANPETPKLEPVRYLWRHILSALIFFAALGLIIGHFVSHKPLTAPPEKQKRKGSEDSREFVEMAC